MEWFLGALKKYAVFSGRARRKEYWMFVLFYFIFGIVAMVLDNILGLKSEYSVYGAIYVIYSLALFLPGLGVTVRRLHDTGKSGFWVLISLIPLVGFIVMLVFTVTEGTQGDNQYGPDPKAIAA